MSNTITKKLFGAAKAFTVAALVASTIGVVAAPPASAARKRYTCEVALAVAQSYIVTGQVLASVGDTQGAMYWYGKHEGVLDACC